MALIVASVSLTFLWSAFNSLWQSLTSGSLWLLLNAANFAALSGFFGTYAAILFGKNHMVLLKAFAVFVATSSAAALVVSVCIIAAPGFNKALEVSMPQIAKTPPKIRAAISLGMSLYLFGLFWGNVLGFGVSRKIYYLLVAAFGCVVGLETLFSDSPFASIIWLAVCALVLLDLKFHWFKHLKRW